MVGQGEHDQRKSFPLNELTRVRTVENDGADYLILLPKDPKLAELELDSLILDELSAGKLKKLSSIPTQLDDIFVYRESYQFTLVLLKRIDPKDGVVLIEFLNGNGGTKPAHYGELWIPTEKIMKEPIPVPRPTPTGPGSKLSPLAPSWAPQ